MALIEVDALPENLEAVNDFLAEQFMGYPMKLLMQLNLVVEEVFINIANYAYKDGVGKTSISCDIDDENRLITIVFEDSGIAFNPLEREDPDVTASAEEREIGGLGIFLTKKMMDDVRYENKNGKNRLTVIKKF